MNKRPLILLAPLLLLALAGCATVGNEKLREETPQTMSHRLVEGKTTKDEVQQALGSATSVAFTDAGNEIWTFKYARATPKAQNFIPFVGLFSRGADVTTKELVVMFDRNGVVSRYTMRETQDVVRQGLLQ
jgi:outer membrane protein assembly factor BamE (lipoprotein component of BamABCDE complex)